MGNPKYQRFFALIDDYVHGQLSESEEKEMERAMRDSTILASRVEEARAIKEAAEAEAKIRGERVKDKLSGELTLQQELQFAEDLEEDTLLKEELDLEGQVDEGFRQLRYQKFKAEADRWKDELPLSDEEEQATAVPLIKTEPARDVPLKKAKTYPFSKWLAVAASLLVLVAAVLLLRPYFFEDDAVIAARESFTMPTFNGTRGGSSGNVDYDKGFEYFQNEEYRKASIELRKVEETDPNYQRAQLLVGLIGLKVPDMSGFTNLTKLNLSDSRFLSELSIGSGLDMRQLTELDIRWYIALSHLKEGRKEEGIELLDSILLKQSHPFFEEAKELRRKLD